MNIFKRFTGITLMWLACCCSAEVQMKDENGKYRHDDPEVRQEFLTISDTLRSHKMYPKAEKLLKTLTSKWAKAGYKESLDSACQKLFLILIQTDRLHGYEAVMKSCPENTVYQELLLWAEKSSDKYAFPIYQYAIESWKLPEQKKWLDDACFEYARRLIDKGLWDDLPGLSDSCGLDVIEQQFFRIAKTDRWDAGLSRSRTQKILHYYLTSWPHKKTEENQERACEQLAGYYLSKNRNKDLNILSEICNSKSINKARLLWAQSLGVGKIKKSIKVYQKLIDGWQNSEYSDDQFRACQLLYWTLVNGDMVERSEKYMKKCPKRHYARTHAEIKSHALMSSYLLDQSARLVKLVSPSYPKSALKNDIDGYVLVEFSVLEDGTVTDVKVVESMETYFNGVANKPTTVFDKAAVKAAKKCKYNPALSAGVPKKSTSSYKFVFKMAEDQGRHYRNH